MKFEEFGSLYVELYSMKKKKSWREDVRAIKLHLKPSWANKELKEITRLDVERMHADISKTHKVQANRVLILTHCMFERAKEWELLQTNPASGISKNREEVRQRILEEDELPRFLASLEQEKNPVWRNLFKLYLLTGCRKGELLDLLWSDVSFERREICLRAEICKTGRGRILPLSDLALSLFRELPRISDYCFQWHGKRIVDIRRALRRVCKRAGITNLHPHDLRKTFASRLAASGVNLTVIRDALGHTDIKTTQIYTIIRSDNLRAAMDNPALITPHSWSG